MAPCQDGDIWDGLSKKISRLSAKIRAAANETMLNRCTGDNSGKLNPFMADLGPFCPILQNSTVLVLTNNCDSFLRTPTPNISQPDRPEYKALHQCAHRNLRHEASMDHSATDPDPRCDAEKSIQSNPQNIPCAALLYTSSFSILPPIAAGSAFAVETIPDIGGLWESEIGSFKKSSFPDHNVAPNGQSSQSSTKKSSPSRYAIDSWVSTCTMTEVEDEPWWSLDLRSNHIISFVAVTNRRDCCAEKLDGAEIHIGNNADWKENPRCGVVSSIGLGETFSFPCGGLQGRYVTIALPNKNTSLSLCEVQVFGHRHEPSENEINTSKESENLLHGAPNVAQRGTASQSSDYAPATPARLAIDGSFSNNYPQCTHTDYDQDPWWTLDLRSKMRVFSVAITNRADCCEERMNGVEVRIGDAKGDGQSNPRCAIISSIAKGKTLAVNCHGMEGQYVSIIIEGRKEYLTLCEVQVFALPAEKKEEIIIFPELQPTKDPRGTSLHMAVIADKQKTEDKKEGKAVDAGT
ncbi:uncharacterized protein RB166_017978 [Leptodactylus fuscus]|uniref:uncharacterized protein LOC142217892 n=1 Tax=Leptodactylus fuscus TaxID=238119 RepID=UPI003F4F01C5